MLDLQSRVTFETGATVVIRPMYPTTPVTMYHMFCTRGDHRTLNTFVWPGPPNHHIEIIVQQRYQWCRMKMSAVTPSGHWH